MHMHNAAVALQLVVTLVAVGIGLWVEYDNRRLRVALIAQRRLTGQTRQPVLTRVMPLYHAPRAEADLPRFH